MKEFIPKSFSCLRNYNPSLFRKDLIAGVTVGILALPLAMAFAIASGVGPEKGLFTAIVAGFLISALGGSRVQIGGPTGAFVVIVYGIIQRTGYEGLAISTLIASALLLLFGLLRLGSWIRYIPHPLITGFTTGLALLIFSAQIKDLFGLKMGAPPVEFLAKWEAYFSAFPSLDVSSLALGLGTLALALVLRRWVPKVPWAIGSISIASIIAYLFHLPIETIQSKFGSIPSSLPLPSLPSLSVELKQLPELFLDAIAIAFLGGIESLLSALIGDGMVGGRHRSNCELVGQAVANFASILFGGIPATGAIARTAANAKTGAQTPVAGMIHALTLLSIIAFFSPVVSQIPLAALAAVLIVVAWNMSELHHFVQLLKAPPTDVAILLTAFFFTVFFDITWAIVVGTALSSLLFMKKMSHFSQTVCVKPSSPEIELYEIHGPFFFGASDLLKKLEFNPERPPKYLILQMQKVPLVDASGMHALKEFLARCKKQNTTLILSSVNERTIKDLKRFGMIQLIGEENLVSDINTAISRVSLIER
jgi:SulP family sulfate permease